MANEIKKRALGNTGIEISELGFGAWPLAGLGRGSAYGAITEDEAFALLNTYVEACLLYTSPSPRDRQKSRMPSSA